MRTPVTRSSLRQHLNYNWWKYVCVLIAAIFGWNLIYTVTAYHPPQERVLSFHVATGSGDTDAINEYMQSKQQAFPSIEVFESSVVVEDEYYKAMQLTTKVAARQVDIMLLDTSSFRSYGTSGMLIPLEDYPELIAACEEAGLSLDMGYVILEESHEKHLLGIPTDSLTGLNNLWIVTKGGYLTISASSDNYDESVQMIITMIHDMHP